MTVRTKHIQSLIVATLVVVFPYVALASSEGCILIDPSRTAQFVSYEGMSDSDVLLKLHNNSDCPIIVETDDHEPFMLQGKKYVSLHYLLHGRRRETLKPGHG